MIRAFTCLLCFVPLSFLPAAAQNKALQFHLIHLPGTFPERGVYKTLRDKAGLLWYTTNDGLYRYDGNEVLHLGLHSEPALPHKRSWRIRTDGRGNIWLAYNTGAAKFDLEKWTITSLYSKKWTRNKPKDKAMSAIGCLPNGKVYYGTGNGKLYVVQHDSLRKVAAINGCINYIDEPVPGHLWLATAAGEMVKISIVNGKYQPPKHFRLKELEKKSIDKICYDSSGRFLMLCGGQLFYGNVHDLTAHAPLSASKSSGPAVKGLIKPVSSPSGKQDITFLFSVGKNDVAVRTGTVGTPGNYYFFNFMDQSWNSATGSSGIKLPGYTRNINHINSGAVISATESITMMQVRNLPFSVLLNKSESKIAVRAIYKSGDDIYIGTYPQGLFRYNVKSGSVIHISDRIINNIIRWNKDSLLMADQYNGLFWYFPSRHIFKHNAYRDHPQGRIASTFLFRVNDSLILKGSYLGTCLINPVKGENLRLSTYPHAKGFFNCTVHAIISLGKKSPTKLGTYLIGTSLGVYNVNLDKKTAQYFMPDTIPDRIRRREIFSLMEVDDKIWLGSGGLGILATDSSGRLCSMDWLNSKLKGKAIYSLSKFGDDIYIGTNKGLHILHLKDSTISYCSTEDGLPANEFNPAAVFKDGEHLYLGTINGIVGWKKNGYIHREKLPLPDFHINKLTVVNKKNIKKIFYNFPYLEKDSQQITIPANAKYFSLTFGNPGQVNKSLSYFYRLNADEDWINLGNKRSITFINTPPGHYQLQFATKTQEGKLIPGKWLIPLFIKPAFRQTLYFKILLGLAFAGVFFLVFRYRERQKNKERDLRMKIAGDLHDEVGSSLAAIRHQNNRAIQSTSSGIKAIAKPLRAVEEISEKALSMMSDIVWSIDARFDTRDAFVIRMKDHVYSLKNNMGIPVNLKITGNDHEDMKMHQAVRQNLFLIFKEAVNNAMKYGDNNPIHIHLHFDGKLILKISNKYNINCKEKHDSTQGGHGLTSMKRRAKQIHADLQIKKTENTFVVLVSL